MEPIPGRTLQDLAARTPTPEEARAHVSAAIGDARGVLDAFNAKLDTWDGASPVSVELLATLERAPAARVARALNTALEGRFWTVEFRAADQRERDCAGVFVFSPARAGGAQR